MAAIQLVKKNPTYQNIPPFDIDILLAHALKKPKEFLYAHPEYKLNIIERLRLAYFLFLYKRGYSVAAITHHKEFYGLDFYVNRHTLIPRPETEVMVDEVVETTTSQPTCLVDVGTGSGCIAIAIAKQLTCHPEQSEGSSSNQLDPSVASLPQNDSLKIYATDISRPALRVAKKNARIQNVSINFLHGNLLEPFLSLRGVRNERRSNPLTFQINLANVTGTPARGLLRSARNDMVIITANLPYLTPEQFATEPSIQREPRSALVAGKDGLALYEKLLQQIKSLLLIVNCSLLIFLEIDPSQTSRTTSLIKQYLPQSSIEIKTDLAGRDRIVKIVYSSIS